MRRSSRPPCPAGEGIGPFLAWSQVIQELRPSRDDKGERGVPTEAGSPIEGIVITRVGLFITTQRFVSH
jgi:hypothetical protein